MPKSKANHGVRKRLGRPVRDAADDIQMVLTRAAVERAEKRRHKYEIDDPQNFTDCVMAECLAQMSGAEVLVARRYAWIAFPGEEFTRRYVMAAPTAGVVDLNDHHEYDKIPDNMLVTFHAPSPGRRLENLGRKRVSKQSRGILENPPKRAEPELYRGERRDGRHATEAA